ncbi:MAG: hypothetical protein JWR10_3089 [Rubritepida sp.]|nr:hypothetical protein [Rubritepida sp.]
MDLARAGWALALTIALVALLANPVLAQQAAQVPATAAASSAGTPGPDAAYRVTPPRVPAPRARSRDPRDRAFMDGGVPSTPGFSGFGERTPHTPAPLLGEPAPRPNRDIEWHAPPPEPTVATISPTLINPRMPSRGAAADGAVTQRDQRFLENPAAGARFSVPMSW